MHREHCLFGWVAASAHDFTGERAQQSVRLFGSYAKIRRRLIAAVAARVILTLGTHRLDATNHKACSQIPHAGQETRALMRATVVLITIAYAGFACGKLPPQPDAAKAQAAETAAKAAWNDKVSLYKTCLAMDRTADAYRRNLKAAGKDIPTTTATAPCADPGPYVAPVTPVESKPLEASGAHSPPGTATSPPSTNTPAAEMPKATK